MLSRLALRGIQFRPTHGIPPREAQSYVSLLEELVSIRNIERQVEIVQSLCALVHQQLLDGGWATGQGGNPYALPLLNDKIELENPNRDRMW